MFSYVFMKILEMRPRSYDQQMDKISRGRIRAIKSQVAGEIAAESHVLEIGCGTGELAGMVISRGCRVEGFDLSPSMIAAARERISEEELEGRFKVQEMGVDGMDGFPDKTFDLVVSTLVFSELTDDERHYAFQHAWRVLKPKGGIIIADEVMPNALIRRIFHKMVRWPMLALTYLVSGHSTRPIADLAGEIEKPGFRIQKEVRSHGDSFAIVKAFKPNHDEIVKSRNFQIQTS